MESAIPPRIDFEKRDAAVSEAEAKLKSDFAKVASTDEGRAVLRYLMLVCGLFRSSIETNKNGEITPLNTIHNEGMRIVWLTVRGWIPYENLVHIELPQPKQVKEDE